MSTNYTTDLTLGIVGSGGDGIVASGDILANAAANEGLRLISVKSFGAQIRGGESSYKLRICTQRVMSQGDLLDAVIVFNWDDYKCFQGELEVKDGVVVICDTEPYIDDNALPLDGVKPSKVFRVPFAQLLKQYPKARKNMIALGAAAELLGLPKDGLKDAVRRKFGRKSREVVEANSIAINTGIEFVRSNKLVSPLKLKYTPLKQNYLFTGNEAIAYGALTAGCRFFASYPITPASEIAEWLSRELPKFGGVVVQAEDEIASACMVIGASFGGVKAMTATSGPGFSLKIETIGLGAMAELPMVIVDVQRGGPATGLPTKSEQADLWQAIGGMHGDAPHAVLAPTSVEDCFYTALEAFRIAEVYQMPVIILSDQFLGHRRVTMRGFDLNRIPNAARKSQRSPERGEYKRFAITADGVSPLTCPGVAGGEYLASGIEHDERGFPSSKHTIHEMMCEKRARKLAALVKEKNFIYTAGETAPKTGIITWGSTFGAVEEAVATLNSKGRSVGALAPWLLYPLQADPIQKFAQKVKKLIIVEMSYTGQFRDWLATKVKLPEDIIHLKFSGGRQFTVEEILKAIENAG